MTTEAVVLVELGITIASVISVGIEVLPGSTNPVFVVCPGACIVQALLTVPPNTPFVDDAGVAGIELFAMDELPTGVVDEVKNGCVVLRRLGRGAAVD